MPAQILSPDQQSQLAQNNAPAQDNASPARDNTRNNATGKDAGAQGDALTPDAPLDHGQINDPELQRVQELFPNGVTVVLYANYTKNGKISNNDAEFLVQGRGAGQRYNAISGEGGKLTIGKGISFKGVTDIQDQTVAVRNVLKQKYDAAKPDGASSEEPKYLKVLNLAIFAHGGQTALYLPGTNLTTSNAESFVQAISGAVHNNVNIQLYACNAGKNGADSLGSKLSEELGDEASVYAHTTAAHTTENPDAVVFGAQSGAGQDGRHMFSIMFPPEFIEAEITRIWGSVTDPAKKQQMEELLTQKMNFWYRKAAGGSQWHHSIKDSVAGETAGEGYYKNMGMFGREMFINPTALVQLPKLSGSSTSLKTLPPSALSNN